MNIVKNLTDKRGVSSRMKIKDRLLERLKKSLFAGIVFSILITSIWFFTLNSGMKKLAGVILAAALVVFALKIVFGFVVNQKMNQTTGQAGSKGRLLANIAFLAFALAVFFSTTVCVAGSAMLFPTVFDGKAYKKVSSYGQAEELMLETEYGTVSGWFLHNTAEPAPLVLYFGGNNEDSSGRIRELLENERELSVFSGYNFASLDYFGYGKSGGSASEKTLKRYGLAVYDGLAAREDVSSIVLMGYGIGTGVANYVAGQRNPEGMVLFAPYADGYDLYNNYANIFHGPMKALAFFKMKAVKFAKDVKVKPLILASKADEKVPYKSSVELFQAYSRGCNFVTIDKIRHHEFWQNEEVLSEVGRYLSE